MESRYTVSTRIVWAILGTAFGVLVYQAAVAPISPPEAWIYDTFVRPPVRQVFEQRLLNRDVLYAILEKRSIGLFHVSPFAVRLPGLLASLLFFWAACSLWPAGRLLMAPVAAGAAVLSGIFTFASGTGLAVALLALAVKSLFRHSDRPYQLNFCGIALGLSVASRTSFWIPAAALAITSLLLLRRQWTAWAERMLIPALVAAFVLLVLPLTHADMPGGPPPRLTPTQAANLQSALGALRLATGVRPVRISASASVEPVVGFYRAQHRIDTWARPPAGPYDYYLLSGRNPPPPPFAVLYQNGDFVVARPAD